MAASATPLVAAEFAIAALTRGCQNRSRDDRDRCGGMLTMAELPGAERGMFRPADRARDGVLSDPEFTDSRLSDFDAADRDGSGTLGPAEVDAYR